MTDINAMIQAVLDTGDLGLPEGLAYTDGTFEIADQHAYDLIAMHWARNRPTLDAGQPHGVRFVMALMRGDSEAAISAIHAALCGGKRGERSRRPRCQARAERSRAR